MKTPPPVKKPKYNVDCFTAKAVEAHGQLYDYSLATDFRLNTKIPIGCRHHGIFYQRGQHHLNGSGCPRCGIEARSGTGSPSHQRRFQKIAEKGAVALPKGKIQITCSDHGAYETTQAQFLSGSTPCPECERNRMLVSLSEKKIYYQEVRRVTERHWRNHRGFIDPHFEWKPRGRMSYHIDHMFPVIEGFLNRVSPEIVGHWCNLALIPYWQNLSRGRKPLRSLQTHMWVYNRCYEEYPDER